jgi:CelD/BcsL family acetyltransferase involved in cellulose biosynthesis
MLIERRVSYVAELRQIAARGQTVLEALRRHTASKIRRTARRLEEAHGPISVQWASTLEEAHDIFEEMCALHNARWASRGLHGAFASERFSRFHRDLIDRLFAGGQILLARVKAGDTTVGCDYGMIEHGRVLSYQWGIATFEDSRLSPGLLTGATIMQAAMERGLVEYDWLAGDVLYKRELSTSSRELLWARHTEGLYIHMLDAAARTARVARHTIRKRPIEHRAKTG